MRSKRAGREVFAHVRRIRLATVRRNWRFLAVWFVVAVPTIWIVQWIQPSVFVSGFFAGVLATVAVVVPAISLFRIDGTLNRRMGGEAERWTAEDLRKLNRRTWAVFDDVPFGTWNIDHVVVGTEFVVAVETKWTTFTPRFGPVDRHLEADARQCERGAAKLRLLFRSYGLTRTVVPLLVYWGSSTKDAIARGQRIRDVRVVRGGDAVDWLRALQASTTSITGDFPAIQALTDYISRTDEHRKESQGGLLTRMRAVLRTRGA